MASVVVITRFVIFLVPTFLTVDILIHLCSLNYARKSNCTVNFEINHCERGRHGQEALCVYYGHQISTGREYTSPRSDTEKATTFATPHHGPCKSPPHTPSQGTGAGHTCPDFSLVNRHANTSRPLVRSGDLRLIPKQTLYT